MEVVAAATCTVVGDFARQEALLKLQRGVLFLAGGRVRGYLHEHVCVSHEAHSK